MREFEACLRRDQRGFRRPSLSFAGNEQVALASAIDVGRGERPLSEGRRGAASSGAPSPVRSATRPTPRETPRRTVRPRQARRPTRSAARPYVPTRPRADRSSRPGADSRREGRTSRRRRARLRFVAERVGLGQVVDRPDERDVDREQVRLARRFESCDRRLGSARRQWPRSEDCESPHRRSSSRALLMNSAISRASMCWPASLRWTSSPNSFGSTTCGVRSRT